MTAEETRAGALNGKSKAKVLQQRSQKPAKDEPLVTITAILDNGHELHLQLPESVVLGILDPDTPDCFLEVPIAGHLKGSVKYRFLHTSRLKEVWVHSELRRAIGG